MRQVLYKVGEPSRDCSRQSERFAHLPQSMGFAPLLDAPDIEFEAIPALELDQTADLEGKERHNPLMHAVELGAAPIPELEFDQTLGW